MWKSFFKTTTWQRISKWLLLIIDMFMFLLISGPNNSGIIVLLKGTLTLMWKSANLHSYKNNLPKISHYNIFNFMRLCSSHLKISTMLSRHSITAGISFGKMLLWTSNFFSFWTIEHLNPFHLNIISFP